MMTNYMELLMINQPWNLIFFMVIPVSLAECLVATEFYILYKNNEQKNVWRTLNRLLGIIAGIYFLLVFLYIVTQILPHIEWRGWVDIIAVGAYLFGVAPLLAITLLELNILGKNLTLSKRTYLHFLFLIAFLIVSHIAMIFGMVNPAIVDFGQTHNHETHTEHTNHGNHTH